MPVFCATMSGQIFYSKEKAEEPETEKAEEPEEEYVINFDEVKNCNPMQLDFMQKVVAVNTFAVMVAGKSRRGKSTALNNLLGLKLPTGCGVKSVTQTVTVESTTSQHGVRVCGIDTPGIQAIDLGSKKVWKDMSGVIGQGVDKFTLLYCISACDKVDNNDDREVMKGLTDRFGADIWKRCILVLTFCDTARNENYETEDKDEAYKAHLRDCVEVFRGILGEFVSNVPPVKLILDCEVVKSPDNDKMTEVKTTPDTIVAVPVARSREDGRKLNILPGFNIGGNIDWTEYAFYEVVKKSGRFSMPEIIEFKSKYNLSTAAKVAGATVAGGGGGAAVGAGIGALIGLVGGPPGVVLGAGIGAVAGVTVGAVGTFAGYLWRVTH